MKEGNYIRIHDKKEHRFLGITEAKNGGKKGKVHLGKIVVNGNYVNLFKSAGGCYLCTLDGDMVYEKVAILAMKKDGRDMYFAMSKSAFIGTYRRKSVAC